MTETQEHTQAQRYLIAVQSMDGAGWTVVFDDDLKQYLLHDEHGAVNIDASPTPTLAQLLENVYELMAEASSGD